MRRPARGGEIVLTEDRRVQGTGGTLNGRNVQRVPTNPNDPTTQQLRQQTLGKKLQKAFEYKYLYGRKIQDPTLKKRFLETQIKASDIDQLVVDGKKIRRSHEFQLERCAGKDVKAWVQSHPQAFPGLSVDHRAGVFQALAHEARSLDGNRTEPISVIEERARKNIDDYLDRVSQYMSRLPQDTSLEHRQILLYTLLHPSMTKVSPKERPVVMELISNYFMSVTLPRCNYMDQSVQVGERRLHDADLWKTFFGLPLINENEKPEKTRQDFIPELFQQITKDRTFFRAALEKNSLETVKLLVEHGFPVNATGNEGRTPLHEALEHGNPEIAKILIAHGADIKAVDQQGKTCLHLACRSGNLNLVNLLIQFGADINTANSSRALNFACRSNKSNLELVKFLVDRGADVKAVDEHKRTPLHFACQSDNLELVKFLVDRGADVKAVASYGRRPIDCAWQGHKWDIVGFLLKIDNRQIKTADRFGTTPLHEACLTGNFEIIKSLLEHGADAKKADDDGTTGLHLACLSGKIETVKLLLEHGADAKAVNQQGSTPLLEACKSGNTEIVKLLMECGVDVNAGDRGGWSPLHSACWSGTPEMVRVLLEHGAGRHSVDEFGCTPLHWAVRTDRLETVEALLINGANINAVDRNGRTPLDYALMDRQWSVAKFLLEHGAAIDVEAYFVNKYRDQAEVHYLGLKGDSVVIDGKPVSRHAFLSYSNDYLTLFTNQEFCDHQLTTSDQQVIPIDKKMFEARLGRGISEADMAFFSTMKADRIQPFIQWMYSGLVSPQNEPSVREICRHFGIGDKEFYLKNGPAGLRHDMEKLYRNDQSKDFAILSGDRRIPVDRMVLSARTTLFRNMFREVKDGSNQVKDYSGLSFEALNLFINYLYTDRIDDTDLTMEIIAELKNTYEFFLADRNESDLNNPSSFIRKLTDAEERLKSRLPMQNKD